MRTKRYEGAINGEYPIRKWIELFNEGKFDNDDVFTQIDAGFFDWFCKNTSLANKTKFMGKKILQLINSPKIDVDNMYVFFKNNCPCNGPLYDDFRICDIKTGKVLFCISNLKKGCYGINFNRWEIWDFSNKDKGSCIINDAAMVGSWDDIKKYMMAE